MRGRDKTVTCAECGADFVCHRRNARFCTTACRRKAYERENKDVIRQRQREYVAAHREQRRETVLRYDSKHREEKNAKGRDLYNEDSARGDAKREYSRQYYQRTKERRREYGREYRAQHAHNDASLHGGVSREVLFAAYWESQAGRCYLCGDDLRLIPRKEVHIDHDHACCGPERTCEKCRRGLACKRCNFIIAWAGEDPDRLRRIAANLEAAKAAHHVPPSSTPEVVSA